MRFILLNFLTWLITVNLNAQSVIQYRGVTIPSHQIAKSIQMTKKEFGVVSVTNLGKQLMNERKYGFLWKYKNKFNHK